MNFATMSCFRQVALIAIANEWVDNYTFRITHAEGSLDVETNSRHVWDTCDEVFDNEKMDMSDWIARYRPDYERLSRVINSPTFLTMNKTDESEQKYVDILDTLFIMESVSLMRELQERVENGWYFQDIVEEMKILAKEVAY